VTLTTLTLNSIGATLNHSGGVLSVENDLSISAGPYFLNCGQVYGSGGGAKTGTFRGQQVDDTAVLVRYTVAGDSNLDGLVSFADLVAVTAPPSGSKAISITMEMSASPIWSWSHRIMAR
jgi:hypothetical protein